jgi:DegV family protein with EDD domain
MGGPRVVVVTDSAGSLPATVAQSLGIVTIPAHVHVDDDSQLEGVGIDGEQVIAALRDGADVTTVAPSVDEIAKVYRGVARSGAAAIVSIHVSSAFSETLARAAEAADRSSIPVTLVDSGTIAMGQSLVAIGAAAVAAEDRTSDEVAGAALAVARSCRFLFTVESLDHLRRGGRISATLRAVGTLLGIRPVMSIHDGETTVVERARNVDGARETIESSMQLYASTLVRPAACIGHSPSEAQPSPPTFKGTVFETTVGASLAAHTGPGTCGIAVAEMPPEFARRLETIAGAS